MKQKKYGLFALSAVIGLLAVCYLVFREPVLAKVGSTSISKKDAALRDRIILLDFPEEKRSMGLYQLMNAAVDFEILRRHQAAPSDGMLEAEELRIDKNTKNPQKLQQIKNLFGADKAAYRRVYIRPSFVERTLYYDYFLNNEQVHKEAQRQAHMFIEKAQKDPAHFDPLAAAENLQVRRAVVSVKDGLVWDRPPMPHGVKLPPVPKHLEEVRQWQELFLKNLKPGDIVPVPVSLGQTLLVVQLVKRSNTGGAELRTVAIPKTSFRDWRAAERAQIPIEVYDHSYPTPQD